MIQRPFPVKYQNWIQVLENDIYEKDIYVFQFTKTS